MANRRTEDFFVTFGSDASTFSKQLKTDLAGAHQEINALNLALAKLDQDVARRSAGGGVGSGLFSNLASTVSEISKLPGSFKTIAADLGSVITSLQTAVGKLSNIKIEVPRASLQVEPETVASAQARAPRQRTNQRTEAAQRAEQKAAEEQATAAETTAKSSAASSAAAKRTAKAAEAQAKAAEKVAQDTEKAAAQTQAAAAKTGPRRFRAPNNEVVKEKTADELEKFLARSIDDYQKFLNKIGSSHVVPKNLAQLDDKGFEKAQKAAVKAVLDFQRNATEILEETAAAATRGSAQTRGAAAKPQASAPVATQSDKASTARAVVGGLSAEQIVSSIPRAVLSALAQTLGVSGRGTPNDLAKAIAGLKIPAAQGSTLSGADKLKAIGVSATRKELSEPFDIGQNYQTLLKAPITKLEQLAKDLGVSVAGNKASLASRLNDALTHARAYDLFMGQAATAAEDLAKSTRQQAEAAKEPAPKVEPPQRPLGNPAANESESQKALAAQRIKAALSTSNENVRAQPLAEKQALARALEISDKGNTQQLNKRVAAELDRLRGVLAELTAAAEQQVKATVAATVSTQANVSEQAHAASAAGKLALAEDDADKALADLAQKTRTAARKPPSEIDAARGRVTAAQNEITRLQGALENGSLQDGPATAAKIARQTEIRDNAQEIVNQGRLAALNDQRAQFEASLAQSISSKQSTSKGFGVKAIQPGLKLVGAEGIASILGAQQLPITEGTNNPAVAVKAVIARLRKTVVDAILDDGERAAASKALDALGSRGGLESLLKSSKGFQLPDLTEAKAAAGQLSRDSLGQRPGANLTRGVKDAEVVVRALQAIIATETEDVAAAKALLSRVTDKRAGAVIPENVRSVIDSGGGSIVNPGAATETRTRVGPGTANRQDFRAALAAVRNSNGNDKLASEVVRQILTDSLVTRVSEFPNGVGAGAAAGGGGGNIRGATGPISRLPINTAQRRQAQLVQLTPEEARDPGFGLQVSKAFATVSGHRETTAQVAIGQALDLLKADPQFSPFRAASFGLANPKLGRGETEDPETRNRRVEAVRATGPIKAAFAAIDATIIEVGRELAKLQRDLQNAKPAQSGAIRAQIESLREGFKDLNGLSIEELLPGAKERQDVRNIEDQKRQARETGTFADANLLRKGFNEAAFGLRQLPGATARDPLSGISLTSSSGQVIPGRFASREEFENRFGGNATPQQEAQFAELLDLRKGAANKKGIRRGGIEGSFNAIARAGAELQRAIEQDDGSPSARTRVETLKAAKKKADDSFQKQLDKYIAGYAALYGESQPILPPEEVKARRDEARASRETLLDPNFKPQNSRDEHLVELARSQAGKEAALEAARVRSLVEEPAANTRGQAGGAALGPARSLDDLLARSPENKTKFEKSGQLAIQAAQQLAFLAAETDGTNAAIRKQITALEKQRAASKEGGEKFNRLTAEINALSNQLVRPVGQEVQKELAQSINAQGVGPSTEDRRSASNLISANKEQLARLQSESQGPAKTVGQIQEEIARLEAERAARAAQPARRAGKSSISDEKRFEEIGNIVGTSYTDEKGITRQTGQLNDPNLSAAGRRVLEKRLADLQRPTVGERSEQVREVDARLNAAKKKLADALEKQAEYAARIAEVQNKVATHQKVLDTPEFALTPEQLTEAQRAAQFGQRAAVVGAAETQRNIPLAPLRASAFGADALRQTVNQVLQGAAEAAKKAEPAAAKSVEQAVEQVVHAAAEAAGAEASVNLPKGIGQSELASTAREAASKYGESVKILTDAQKLSDHLNGTTPLPDRTVSTLRNRLQRFVGQETGGLNDGGLAKLIDHARGLAGTQAHAQNPDLVALGDSINKQLVGGGGGGGPIDVRVVSFGSAATGTLNALRSGKPRGKEPTPIEEADKANVETKIRRRATREQGPPVLKEDVNTPRSRRTPEEIAAANAQAAEQRAARQTAQQERAAEREKAAAEAAARRTQNAADRETARQQAAEQRRNGQQAERLAQFATLPGGAQQAIRGGDALGAAKALSAEGFSLAQSISRVRAQLGLSATEAAELKAQLQAAAAADRAAARKGLGPVRQVSVAELYQRALDSGQGNLLAARAETELTAQKRAQIRAGTVEPVTLDQQGGVHDGFHRIVAALEEGVATLPVRDVVRDVTANTPRQRRTSAEVEAARQQEQIDRRDQRQAERLAQFANLPNSAQRAIQGNDALGAARALTAEGFKLAEAISRVKTQLGLSAAEAATLKGEVQAAVAADRKAGRNPSKTPEERQQEADELAASRREREQRVAAARAQELSTLPTHVQKLIAEGRGQEATNALASSPGFRTGEAAPLVARQLGLDKDGKNALRQGLQAYLREQRLSEEQSRKEAAANEAVNSTLRAEEERLARIAQIFPRLSRATQEQVLELQRLLAVERELIASGQRVPEGLAHQIEGARIDAFAGARKDLSAPKVTDELGRTRSAIPSSDQSKIIRDILGTTGPETDRIGREAAAKFVGGLETGTQAQQSRFNAFFGPSGFFGRIFSTGAAFIVRQFSGSIVFGIGNEIQRTFRQALEAQGEFVRISNGLEANGAPDDKINSLRTSLQGISSDLGAPLEEVYVTASNLVGVFDTPADVAFATKAVEELKLISNGALNAQEGVQSLAAAQEAFPDQFKGAAGFQQLVDLATQLQNVTGVNLEDQLKGLATIGPQAKALNLNPTDALLLPGLIAKRTGQSGDAASEQFSRILASLQSGKGQQALLRAGVSQVAIQGRDFHEIFQELLKGIKDGTVSQTAIQNLVNVAGPKQARAFQAALDNPTKTLDAYAKAAESAGAGSRRVADLVGTLNREIKILQQNLTGLVTKLIDIGALDAFGLLLKGANELLTLLNTLLGAFDKFQQGNGFVAFLTHAALLAAGLGAVLKVVGLGATAFRARLGANAAEKAEQTALSAGTRVGPELGGLLLGGGAQQQTRRELREAQEAARAERRLGALRGGTGGFPSAFTSGATAARSGLFGTNLVLGAAGVGTRFVESLRGMERGTSRASQALARYRESLIEGERANRGAAVASGLLTAAFIALPFLLSAISNRSERRQSAKDALDSAFPDASRSKNEKQDEAETKKEKALKSEGSFGEAILNTYFKSPTDTLHNVAGGITEGAESVFNGIFGTNSHAGSDFIDAAPNSAANKSAASDQAHAALEELGRRTKEQLLGAGNNAKEIKKIQDAYAQGVRDIEGDSKLDDSDKLDLTSRAIQIQTDIGNAAKKAAEEANALKGIKEYTTDQLDSLLSTISQGLSLGTEARRDFGGDIFRGLTEQGLVSDDPKDPLAQAEQILLGAPTYKVDAKKFLAGPKLHPIIDPKTGKPPVGPDGKVLTGDGPTDANGNPLGVDLKDLQGFPSDINELYAHPELYPKFAKRIDPKKTSTLDRLKEARDTLKDNLDAFQPDIDRTLKANGPDSAEYKAAVKRKADAIALINQLNGEIITEAVNGAKNLAAALAVTGGSVGDQQAALDDVVKQLQDGLKNLDKGSAAYNQQLVDIAAARRTAAEFKDKNSSKFSTDDNRAFTGTLSAGLDAATTNDPLQAARDQQAITAQQLATATAPGQQGYSAEDINNLKIQAVNNSKLVAQLLSSKAASEANLVIAIANAAGDTVGSARAAEAEANRVLQEAISKKTGTADINQKKAAAVTAAAATRDAVLNDTLSDLDFQRQIGQISVNTYIQGLQNILKQTNLTKQERQNIQLKIKGLQDDLRQQLTGSGFNIPSNIKLPTAYEVRRSLGLSPVGGNAASNLSNQTTVTNNTTVNNTVSSPAMVQAVAQAVVDLIAQQTGQASRASTPTPSLVR